MADINPDIHGGMIVLVERSDSWKTCQREDDEGGWNNGESLNEGISFDIWLNW